MSTMLLVLRCRLGRLTPSARKHLEIRRNSASPKRVRVMVPSLQSLGIDKLSYDEKRELIEAIEESLEPDVEQLAEPISDELKQLLDSRLAQASKNPGRGISREELRTRLKRVIDHGR